jgi:hypothetical protein
VGQALRERVASATHAAPLGEEVVAAIEAVIEDINANPRLPQSKRQHTDYESALRLFEQHGERGVRSSELQALVSGVEHPHTAVRKLVSRLNEKLEPLGYAIRRRYRYQIVPTATLEDPA